MFEFASFARASLTALALVERLDTGNWTRKVARVEYFCDLLQSSNLPAGWHCLRARCLCVNSRWRRASQHSPFTLSLNLVNVKLWGRICHCLDRAAAGGCNVNSGSRIFRDTDQAGSAGRRVRKTMLSGLHSMPLMA